MSQKPINLSPDLRLLRQEGYNIEIRSGFLLVSEIPFVDSRKNVRRGTLVVKLCLAGDVADKPDNHVALFFGEYPCDADGTPIEKIRHSSETKELAKGITVNHMFSAKPNPPYPDYHAKVSTYCSILSGPAKAIDPAATPKTFLPAVPDEEEDSIFNYIDTASSRAEIDVISQKLALKKVAIIGLGGTGAYILDQVAKTPVREIHLFDKDVLLTHNAFRAPGAPSLEELRSRPCKVDYLRTIYAKMHRGIIAHAVHVDADNVDQLQTMNFVFLCLDDGSAKKYLIEKLNEYRITFIDVGMGVYMGESALGGVVRVTTSTPEKRDHVPARIPLADGNGQNEYAQNIQIADLNALNAALAIIKWKKLFGFYMDFEKEYHSTYGIEVQLLTKEEKGE